MPAQRSPEPCRGHQCPQKSTSSLVPTARVLSAVPSEQGTLISRSSTPPLVPTPSALPAPCPPAHPVLPEPSGSSSSRDGGDIAADGTIVPPNRPVTLPGLSGGDTKATSQVPAAGKGLTLGSCADTAAPEPCPSLSPAEQPQGHPRHSPRSALAEGGTDAVPGVRALAPARGSPAPPRGAAQAIGSRVPGKTKEFSHASSFLLASGFTAGSWEAAKPVPGQ